MIPSDVHVRDTFNRWTLLPRKDCPASLRSSFQELTFQVRDKFLLTWCVVACLPLVFVLLVDAHKEFTIVDFLAGLYLIIFIVLSCVLGSPWARRVILLSAYANTFISLLVVYTYSIYVVMHIFALGPRPITNPLGGLPYLKGYDVIMQQQWSMDLIDMRCFQIIYFRDDYRRMFVSTCECSGGGCLSHKLCHHNNPSHESTETRRRILDDCETVHSHSCDFVCGELPNNADSMSGVLIERTNYRFESICSCHANEQQLYMPSTPR